MNHLMEFFLIISLKTDIFEMYRHFATISVYKKDQTKKFSTQVAIIVSRKTKFITF